MNKINQIKWIWIIFIFMISLSGMTLHVHAEENDPMVKKEITEEVIQSVLGEPYWILNSEQLQILDEAGYDISSFQQEWIEEDMDMIMTFGLPQDYGARKLDQMGKMWWSTATEDKIYMYGANSYWNNGKYVTIHNTHKRGSYNGQEQDAYCLNPYTATPLQGNIEVHTIDNEMLLKSMYYGYQGPGFNSEIEKIYQKVDPYYSAFYNGKGDAYYILTHCLAAMAYNDPHWSYGLTQNAADTVVELYDYMMSLPSPLNTSNIVFEQLDGTMAYLNENQKFQTPNIRVKGQKSDYIEFTVPEHMTMYLNNVRKITENQMVQLYSGDVFYLEAETSYKGHFDVQYPTMQKDYRSVIAFGVQDVGWLNIYERNGKAAVLQLDWPDLKPFQEHKIVVQKTIEWEDVHLEHGNPVFIFKLEGTDKEGNGHTYYKSMNFTEEYINKHQNRNGTVTMEVTFDRLYEGKYTLMELNTGRYHIKEINHVQYGKILNNCVIFELTGNTQMIGNVAFGNEKYEHGFYSDTDLKINVLK